MANEEKLLNLVNVVGEAKDRDEWDQTFWSPKASENHGCGTAMCAAGWQCAIGGLEFTGFASVLVNDEPVYVSSYATEALGLTENQAYWLFKTNFYNDYDLFVETVKKIINGEIE